MTDTEQELTTVAVHQMLGALDQRKDLLAQFLKENDMKASDVELHQRTNDDGSISTWYTKKSP